MFISPPTLTFFFVLGKNCFGKGVLWVLCLVVPYSLEKPNRSWRPIGNYKLRSIISKASRAGEGGEVIFTRVQSRLIVIYEEQIKGHVGALNLSGTALPPRLLPVT